LRRSREVFEFAYALYLAREVDREAAQMIVEAVGPRYVTLLPCPAVMQPILIGAE
jgi:hypothetical protein